MLYQKDELLKEDIRSYCIFIREHSNEPNEKRKHAIKLIYDKIHQEICKNNPEIELINCKILYRLYSKLEEYLGKNDNEEEIYNIFVKTKRLLLNPHIKNKISLLEKMLRGQKNKNVMD